MRMAEYVSAPTQAWRSGSAKKPPPPSSRPNPPTAPNAATPMNARSRPSATNMPYMALVPVQAAHVSAQSGTTARSATATAGSAVSSRAPYFKSSPELAPTPTPTSADWPITAVTSERTRVSSPLARAAARSDCTPKLSGTATQLKSDTTWKPSWCAAAAGTEPEDATTRAAQAWTKAVAAVPRPTAPKTSPNGRSSAVLGSHRGVRLWLPFAIILPSTTTWPSTSPPAGTSAGDGSERSTYRSRVAHTLSCAATVATAAPTVERPSAPTSSASSTRLTTAETATASTAIDVSARASSTPYKA
mmetsp:Transcript_12758/g.32350  ORF Transcript_12758/g.32350 Transcript_12758/m.32350 type:complete len:303 (-) Transcript_12758:865-1773(-)